jgi:hypothetical protein
LRAAGSSTGQPQGRALRRACPGCAHGAGPSGVAALLSGREGGRSGLKTRKSWAPAEELLPGGWILEPMTICGYYWQKIIALQLTISPQSSQSAQDAQRLLRGIPAFYSIAILAGLRATAPGCPSPAHHQLGLCVTVTR